MRRCGHPLHQMSVELAAIMQIGVSSTVEVDPRFIQYMQEAWV